MSTETELIYVNFYNFDIEEKTKIELSRFLNTRRLNGVGNGKYLMFLKSLCKNKSADYQDGLIRVIIAGNRIFNKGEPDNGRRN